MTGITLAGAMRVTAIDEAGSASENPSAVSHLLRGADEIERLEAEVERLTKRPTPEVIGVIAALAAAISLLERSPKSAAPSDRMFDMMLGDYRRALGNARDAFRHPSDG